jgi:ABC-type methionine transport system ATPase subunit
MNPELILVIEDDAAILFGLRDNLQRAGYAVRSASDGHLGLELVRTLRKTLGLTVLMVTHDLDTLWQVADRVAVLADGKVQLVGTMAELAKSNKPAVRVFFEGPRGRAAKVQSESRDSEHKTAHAGESSSKPK